MAREILVSILDKDDETALLLEAGDIILNSEECRILYSELAHHTCSRDHYHEFSLIVRKISKSAQEKTIENATLQAENNLGKSKSHSS